MPKSFFEKNKMLIIVGVVILVILLMVAGMYNSFVTLDQNVNAKWSLVENDYQRQYDTIPNLVSTVSSAVKVETNYVTAVTEARTQWQKASSLYDKEIAGNEMNNAMTNFISAIATAENYPVLQANKQYTMLIDELVGSQNRITVARKNYIEAIQKYNTATKTFPGVLFANMFGFTEKQYYEATTELITPILGTGQLP